jgi:NADPH2:quinone reductase
VRAAVLEGEGGPDRLVVQDVPDPVPGPGEALVDVRAAGINFFDVLVRLGRYPHGPNLPWIPGLEVAGETADGRRVAGFIWQAGGAYAERAAIDEDWLFDLPEDATFEEGAAFLIAFLTAWLPLTRQVDVRSGTRVLVTAAAGGVGTAAVQAARLLGAEVVGVAGSPEKLELVSSLGASEAVTYDDLGSIEPVDVVLDTVGGDLFPQLVGLVRPFGNAVAIGFAGGAWPPLETALLVGRNVGVQGFYLARLAKLRARLVQEAARDLLRLWALGSLRPVVGATFPLEEAAAAHRLVEERRSTGKVVLVP